MENKTKLSILEMNYTLANDWILTSVSSHQDNLVDRYWDSDGSSVQGETQFVSSDVPNVWNTELRLSSVGDSDFWDWTVGAYYQDSDAKTPVFVNAYVVLAPGVNVIAEIEAPATNASEDIGAFIHNAFHLTENGTLTLGVRYTKEERLSIQPFDINAYLILPNGERSLLAEIQRDGLLKKYDTIIIDEAHERSLNIDFLLGYLKQLLPRRPDRESRYVWYCA